MRSRRRCAMMMMMSNLSVSHVSIPYWSVSVRVSWEWRWPLCQLPPGSESTQALPSSSSASAASKTTCTYIILCSSILRYNPLYLCTPPIFLKGVRNRLNLLTPSFTTNWTGAASTTTRNQNNIHHPLRSTKLDSSSSSSSFLLHSYTIDILKKNHESVDFIKTLIGLFDCLWSANNHFGVLYDHGQCRRQCCRSKNLWRRETHHQ